MTFGWSVLTVVAAVLGLLVVIVVFRVARDHDRAARRPEELPEPRTDTTIGHYGHS